MKAITYALVILLVVLCIYYAFIARAEDIEGYKAPVNKRVQFKYRITGGVAGMDIKLVLYDDFSGEIYQREKFVRKIHLDEPQIIAVRKLKKWAFTAKNHYETPKDQQIRDGIRREFQAHSRKIIIDPMANLPPGKETLLTTIDGLLTMAV